MNNIPAPIATLTIGIVITLISFWYGQNHGLMPSEASTTASAVDGLFNTMMTISTGLFLLVQGTLVVAMFRFRRRKGDNTDAEPVHGNIPLEILWTAIPAFIVLGLAVYSFDVYINEGSLSMMGAQAHHHGPVKTQVAHHGSGEAIAATMASTSQELAKAENLAQVPDGVRLRDLNDQQAEPAKPYQVDVMGLQFAWIFTYPEEGIVSGELHIPIDRPISLNITASDVIHAFWVPEFRLKQDAIPGRSTQLQFVASQIGEYPVICAELCGAYHGGMKTRAFVHSPEEFASWVESQKMASVEETQQMVAVNTETLSASEFLAPYVQDMGIQSASLNQIPHTHMSNSLLAVGN